MKKNSDNLRRGREFQATVAAALEKHWGVPFDMEVAYPIGNPAKAHRFDLVSTNRKYVGETKSYTWTETGNMPSAKVTCINEAVFYLSHLPSDLTRFVAMLRDVRPRTGEPLADYYYRTYRHLLNGVLILEIDPVAGGVREVGDGAPAPGRAQGGDDGAGRPRAE